MPKRVSTQGRPADKRSKRGPAHAASDIIATSTDLPTTEETTSPFEQLRSSLKRAGNQRKAQALKSNPKGSSKTVSKVSANASSKSEVPTGEEQENDEEEEEVASDNEEAEGEGKVDAYDDHFGNAVSDRLAPWVDAVDKKQIDVTVEEIPKIGIVSRRTPIVKDTSGSAIFSSGSAPYMMKERITQTLEELKKEEPVDTPATSKTAALSDLLTTHVRAYRDIVHTHRTHEAAQAIRDVYCLHTINHTYRGRDRIIKNGYRISKAEQAEREVPECRDQGFTRPKVLILVPFKHSAYKIVQSLLRYAGCENQENMARFEKEFAPEEGEEEATRDASTGKPVDYMETFFGNVDDFFRVGLKFLRKSVKLYAEFYSSDIIIASPLGLRNLINDKGDKKRDFDFLSSIEILIVDQCDVFGMQNWSHFEHVMNHMNLIPKESHGCDFSRVRNWYLDGKAKYLRQTLLFSSYLTPEMNALVGPRGYRNVAGQVRIQRSYPGSISTLLCQVQQVFNRIPSKSPLTADDDRFAYFKDKTIPTILQSLSQRAGHIIFVPSYFDFVRVRNFLDKEDLDYAAISEYSPPADISRARTAFFKGEANFLVVTERLHFFRRYRIRGAKHIHFYQLPEHANFYPEIIGWLDEEGAEGKGPAGGMVNGHVSATYLRWDKLRLERIVGSRRVDRLLDGEKGSYMFA